MGTQTTIKPPLFMLTFENIENTNKVFGIKYVQNFVLKRGDAHKQADTAVPEMRTYQKIL